MPLIRINLSNNVNYDSEELLTSFSKKISELTGKPEAYVMCILNKSSQIIFAGSNEPCCFLEIKSIGSLKPSQMSEEFCDLVAKLTSISSERVYINFEDIDSKNWGFNRNTFG